MNISTKSEHWPFGNWPGKGPVETKAENERERLRELTAKIAIEQDHDKFTAVIKELNQLWMKGSSRKGTRLPMHETHAAFLG